MKFTSIGLETAEVTVSRHSEPCLTVKCLEPEGTVERKVYPMQLTIENLKIIWEKTRNLHHLFDVATKDDFPAFCRLFMVGDTTDLQPTGLFWVVDDFIGLFYLTDMVLGVDANVHYIFFDRRHHGRAELCREMIKYVFRKYVFQRLTTLVPYYSRKGVFFFITSLGFKKEGRKRKARWYKDDWFDLGIFGILRTEALNGGKNGLVSAQVSGA